MKTLISRPFIGGLVAAFAILLLAGCQGTIPVVPEAGSAQMPGTLAAGDVIKLVFPGAPEFNQAQKIRSDGKISLPLVGEVNASGKKLGEFQSELAELYKAQLKQNEVIVTLESSALSVYISGAVNRPGKILIDRPMTALEAIMEAGGFVPDRANPKKVIIVRKENGQQHTFTLDLSPALKGKTTTAFNLRPYDVIYVSDEGALF